VDDVAANRELMAMLLGYRGHEVIEACDGADALALAQSRHPDVVVSDVLMPGIDGLEMVHRLRSAPDEQAAHAPVIFYTANYLEPETRPIAEACGVSQVVLRSADPRELLDAVDVALRNGPVEINPGPADEFAAVHARAINAKLVEKVRALRHTERRFEAMAASSPVGIVLLDADGSATYVNPRLSEITGRTAEQLRGRGWLDCLEAESHDEALQVIRTGPTDAVEHRYRRRIARADGDARWLRVHLRPLRDPEADLSGVMMVDDVTDVVAAEERAGREVRQRQEEARQRDAERLDSLRRMAGGMAHDFNNLLGAMLGFLHLAIEAIGEEMASGRLAAATGAALLDDLGQVTKGGERAAKLTEQLLAFGRREISQPVVVDVDAFLADSAGELAEAAGPGVRLDLRPGDIPPVTIDPRLLRRLLLILVHNAREAMPAGGTVSVTTGHTARGEATITVADDGRGMPRDVLERAFEPFFSTKAGSRTAGLGLSTAHGVVTQAGGELTLTSEVGRGTTAVVRLPATDAAARPREIPSQTPTGPAAAAGDLTVLLVDDEQDLREVAARFIAKAGYRVLTAGSGAEALEIAERHPDPIDCLVTDVVMPGMDGRELAHQFLVDRPDTKVIFISGYAEALIDDEGRSLEPGRTILPKPFSSTDLTNVLRTTLAAA
jgi:hypothetical protein